MKVYQVGPDSAYDEPQGIDGQYVWLVYWYEEGSYEGNGEAVALGKDGKLYGYDLGHCSCYGPFDDYGSNREDVALADLLEVKDNIHDQDWHEAIKTKVKELLGVENKISQGMLF